MSLRAPIRWLLALLLVLNGCSVPTKQKYGAVPARPLPVGVPSPEELYGIAGEHKSVVLLRVTMTLDKGPVESPADRLEFGIGSIYSPTVLPVIPRVGSENFKNDGWVYFLLRPGMYKLWVLPSGSDPKQFRFQIEVPSDARVLYVGSLSIACTTAASDACAEPIISRQDEAARVVAGTYFGEPGSMKVASIKSYEPPTNQIPHELFPMGILVGSNIPATVRETTGTPAASAAIPLAPSVGARLQLESVNPYWGAPYVVQGIAGTAFLLGVLIQLAEVGERRRAIERMLSDPVRQCFARSRTSLRACQRRIPSELALFRAPKSLAPLLQGLRKQGATQLISLRPNEDLFSKARRQGFKTLLQTEATTVSLGVSKECSACVQAAVVARLWDVRAATLLYEKTFLRRCDEGTTVLSAFPRAPLPFGAYDRSLVFDDRSAGYSQSIRSACDFQGANLVGAQFSPDGKLVASGGTDHTVILWDVVARQLSGSSLRGHTSKVRSNAFSPDGRLLASGSDDNTVILWDMATRKPVGEPLRGHTSAVYSVAFSPDGRVLATGSGDNTVILWDVATRRPMGEPLKGHEGSVFSLAFGPDGALVASGSADDTVILWDAIKGKQKGNALEAHEGAVDSVAFSPDGKLLASGSFDDTIILWNVSDRTQLGEPLKGHKSSVNSVSFSPDGTLLASGSNDETVILWDVANRTQMGKPLKGHKTSVHGVTFSPDGRLLASGSSEAVIIWDVTSRAPVVELIEQPTAVRQALTSAMETATRLLLGDFRLHANMPSQ